MGSQEIAEQARTLHKDFLFKTAANVEKLISKPEYAARFRAVWQTFSKRVASGKGENPLHWFRPKAIRPRNDKDRVLIDYVMLTVIHEHNLRPQWQQICQDPVWWADSIWCWLRVWSYDRNKTNIEIYKDSVQEAETIRIEIQLAFEHILTDLANLKPTETDSQQGKFGFHPKAKELNES